MEPVTERDEVDPGLRALDERALLAAIVDSTDDAVVSVDRDRRITSWNAGAAELYGHAASEVVGRPVDVLFGAEEEADAAIAPIFAGRRIAGREVRRVRADGTLVMVGESLSPIRSADGEVVGAALITRDITDRVRAEQELAATRLELEANLQQLERSNNDLEQFAYVASHDLSEPLRAVSGMVGLLARRYEGRLDDDADEFIRFAIEGCERMRHMIEDLLAYSRAGRGELRVETIDTGAVVAAVLASLAPQVEAADAVVEVGALPAVRADRNQLAAIFQNLISNAVKFGRPGGAVHVEVTADEAGDDGWRFSVVDDGIGIEEQYRTRIFRMFQRLHPADRYPGTGIGLAIADRIVERHGGRIGVDASPSGGSTFWFTIPDLEEGARP